MYVNIDSETNVFTHESINRLIIVNMILFIDFVVLLFVIGILYLGVTISIKFPQYYKRR